MKRSRAVPLTLVASATSLAACGGERESLQCVERGTDRVVAESLCTATNAPTVADTSDRARTTAGGIPPLFLWYFGGRAVSGIMSGGGYAPVAGRRYASPGGFAYAPGRGITRGAARATPARGGFGRTGAGRVGGG